jgi:hypothetical protein
LTEDDAHLVEAKMRLAPGTRAEAEALRKTWDLLDFLPTPEPSPNFTNRTLDRIGPVRKTQKIPRQGLRVAGIGLVWAASLLVAVAAGYGGMSWFLKSRDSSDQDLARDLRLIENEHLYEVGEDMDFLRELDKPDAFGDEPLGS